MILLLSGTTPTKANPKTEDYGTARDLWAFVGLILIFLIGLLIDWSIKRLLERSHATILISEYLSDRTKRTLQERVRGIPNPLARKRSNLTRIAASLTSLGWGIDGHTPPHPIATLLFAVAWKIRNDLAQPQSLVATHDAFMKEVLRHALITISGPHDRNNYIHMAKALRAYENSLPRPELRSGRPSRWTFILTRSAEVLEPYYRLIAAVYSISITAVVVYLILTGRISLSSIELQR
jgi:hypothetical protein